MKKMLGLQAVTVCPLNCSLRGDRIHCYHEEGENNYWNCETFREYLFRTQLNEESLEGDRRGNTQNTSNGLVITQPSLRPQPELSIPGHIAVELIRRGILKPTLQELATISPHCMRLYQQKIWRNYHGPQA